MISRDFARSSNHSGIRARRQGQGIAHPEPSPCLDPLLRFRVRPPSFWGKVLQDSRGAGIRRGRPGRFDPFAATSQCTATVGWVSASRRRKDGEGAAVLACTETATRTETTQRRSTARGALRSILGLLEAVVAQLAAERRGRTSAPGRRPWARSPGETPSPAHFAAALEWGMRARWLQVAAEQLPGGERGEARGRQPRPEICFSCIPLLYGRNTSSIAS
ncbi:uncharacterized protein LOC124248700 [Equus quagga]|uniref:uncharacterized protein LOC124248700 n=1 Tax=Equus quagga TaxID=89248 RepID=UPI001EE2E82C|nr:uncharacterized protein LOC124248700 [Equus quagga]